MANIALLYKNKKIMMNVKRIRKNNIQEITTLKRHYIHAVIRQINKWCINFRPNKRLKQLLKNVEYKLV